MTPENFVYWLQGFMEIGNPTTLTEPQVQEIKNHLALVLRKETPYIKIDSINGVPLKIKDHACISKCGEGKCKYCGEECNVTELNNISPYISREQTWPQRLPDGVSFCSSAPPVKLDFPEFQPCGTSISPFFKDNPFHIGTAGQIVPGSGDLEEYYKANGFYPPGCNIQPFGPEKPSKLNDWFNLTKDQYKEKHGDTPPIFPMTPGASC